LEKLGGDPKQAIDQLDLGGNVALFGPFYGGKCQKTNSSEVAHLWGSDRFLSNSRAVDLWFPGYHRLTMVYALTFDD
jgi:hypothetical protein